MKRKNNTPIIRRILKIALWAQVILTVSVFVFTRSAIYSIITLLASLLTLTGFVVMMKLLDRHFAGKGGQGPLFLVLSTKLILIAAIFYPVSRISERAVLFYILGLSVIVISTMIEGAYQLFRSSANGS